MTWSLYSVRIEPANVVPTGLQKGKPVLARQIQILPHLGLGNVSVVTPSGNMTIPPFVSIELNHNAKAVAHNLKTNPSLPSPAVEYTTGGQPTITVPVQPDGSLNGWTWNGQVNPPA
jgi:hypothetical protein